jgi:hypothetical protein
MSQGLGRERELDDMVVLDPRAPEEAHVLLAALSLLLGVSERSTGLNVTEYRAVQVMDRLAREVREALPE